MDKARGGRPEQPVTCYSALLSLRCNGPISWYPPHNAEVNAEGNTESNATTRDTAKDNATMPKAMLMLQTMLKTMPKVTLEDC